jgi:peptidoglycan/LPS O-acetylase OafA/YrhL
VRPSLGILKPSFLDRNADSRPAQPTAWLDGLRGVAAFFVFLYHFQHLFHNNFYMGYGANNGKNDYWLIQLPIIRLIFTGGPMVSVFWVLSGVSLSLKPIKLMRSRSWEQFQETMFSSVFRRALRLYIPVYTVQLCVLLATLLGFFDHASDLHKDWPFKGGTNEDFFEVKNTAGEQIYDWVTSMVKLSSPFKPIRPKYDVHLWTIPLEFRNSIVLFATLVAFSKLRSRIRIVLSLALYSYCVLVEEGDVALFIAGMTCAEFLLIKDEQAKQLPAAEKPSPRTQSLRAKIIWTIVYITGLHLLSIPAWRFVTICPSPKHETY